MLIVKARLERALLPGLVLLVACSASPSKGGADAGRAPGTAGTNAPGDGAAGAAGTGGAGAGNVDASSAPDGGGSASNDAAAPPASDAGPNSGPTAYEAERGFLAGGTAVTSAHAGFSGSGYVSGFASAGAEVISAIDVATAAPYDVTFRYASAAATAETLTLYVNGYRSGPVSFPATSGAWADHGERVELRAGLNTLALVLETGDGGGLDLDAVLVPGGVALTARGATTPWIELEAEAALTNATVVGPGREYGTLEAECSGRKAVRFDKTGDFVSFTLSRAANTLVVRASIPDSADGQGQSGTLGLYVDGRRARDLTLSSKYAWVYGAYPYDNTPAAGAPHHYFDEQRFDVGELPAGAVLKLQKDAGDTLSPVTIDLVDLEEAPPAFAMPPGFLSIAAQGAVADDGQDDSAAIAATIALAQTQKKGVFVPPGTFEISGHVALPGVTLAGAGPWRSVLHGKAGKGGLFGGGGRIAILDLAIFGDVSHRDDANFDTAIEGNFGVGSLVQNVWIEHAKVGMWIDGPTDGLYVVGMRIRDTFADGVNIHKGTRGTRFDQSHVRNTGDDGLAMFSEGQSVTGCAFTFDTVTLPMLANDVGLYGGTDNRVEDNLLSDTVNASAGIAVSTRFSPVPFAGTTSVQRNTLTRTGGYEHNWMTAFGAIWLYADSAALAAPVLIKDVDVVDSSYQGLLLSGGNAIGQVTFDGVHVTGAGSYGIDLSTTGSATFQNVTVSGASMGALNNPGGYTLVRGAGNSGF